VNQTLGEEYVDIWQRSARTSRVPTAARRWSLVLLYCLPPYLAARQQRQRQGAHDAGDTLTKRVLRMLPSALEVALEVNLALFYFSGSYYSLAKRLLGVKHVGRISSLRNYGRALIDCPDLLTSSRPKFAPTVLRITRCPSGHPSCPSRGHDPSDDLTSPYQQLRVLHTSARKTSPRFR